MESRVLRKIETSLLAIKSEAPWETPRWKEHVVRVPPGVLCHWTHDAQNSPTRGPNSDSALRQVRKGTLIEGVV